MKKFVFALLLGVVFFAGFMGVQGCTNAKAQETPIPSKTSVVKTNTDTPTATNVFVGTIDDGQDLTLPLKLKQFSADSTVSLNVVFTQPVKGQSFWAWIVVNVIGFVTIGLFIVQIIVNITPTQKDNNVFAILKLLVDSIFKSKNSSGGYF